MADVVDPCLCLAIPAQSTHVIHHVISHSLLKCLLLFKLSAQLFLLLSRLLINTGPGLQRKLSFGFVMLVLNVDQFALD